MKRSPLGQLRADATDSEIAGAILIGPQIKTIHDRVLELFYIFRDMTDEELRTHYEQRWGHIEKNVLEPRRTELVQMGLLRKTDLRRKGKSGVGRIVWEHVHQPEQLALI